MWWKYSDVSEQPGTSIIWVDDAGSFHCNIDPFIPDYKLSLSIGP